MDNNLPVRLYGQKICIPFYKFIDGIKKFRIPPYQRQYVWRVEKAKELWTSILNNCKNNKSIWLGVILGSKRRDGETFDIIDGQQRILTFLLLCSFLYPDHQFWEELSFTHEHLINNNDDVSKKSIFTIEVINHLEKKESNNYLLKKIIKFFQDSVLKSKEDLKKHEFLMDFIKKQLLITVLYTNIDGYPFFESINSGVPLSLYERCYAFVAYNDWKLIKAKSQYFQSLENSSPGEKKKFIEFFIKIFSFQQNIADFEQFKKIYKEEDRKDCFFSFLEEYINQKKKKELYFKSFKAPDFFWYYAYIVAWDNYWPIIVLLYFKKFDEEFIEENFFKPLLILDLNLNLKKVKKLQAKNNIFCAKAIYNCGNFLKKEEILIILNQFWRRKSSVGKRMEELSLNQQELVELSLNSSPEKQVKVLLCILQNSSIKGSEELKKWMNGIGFRTLMVKEVEHLVPQSWNQEGDILKYINKNFNLVLVDKYINPKLGNSCIFCKIKLLCSKNILTIANCACSKKKWITKRTRCYDSNICEEWHNEGVIVWFDQKATIKNIWDINKKKYWEAYLKKIKPILDSYSSNTAPPPPIYPKDIYSSKLLDSNFTTRDCNDNECNNNCYKINDKWRCQWPLIYIDNFPAIKLQFNLVEKPLVRILKDSYFYTKVHISNKAEKSLKLKSIDRKLTDEGIVSISYENNKKKYLFLKTKIFKSLNKFGVFITQRACNAWFFFHVKDDNWPSSQHPFGNNN